MKNVKQWLELLGDQIIRNPAEVLDHRERSLRDAAVDIWEATELAPLSGPWLAKRLEDSFIEEGMQRYWAGKEMGKAEWALLRELAAITVVPHSIQPLPAVTVQLAAVRRFPTLLPLTRLATGDVLDRCQETVLNPGEAVQVLHSSSDCRWSYIRSATYSGWVLAEWLAAAEEEVWRRFNGMEGAVVTAPRWIPQRNLTYLMGARLPYAPTVKRNGAAGLILLPRRTKQGSLAVEGRWIAFNQLVAQGPLPFNQRGLLGQGFRLLGQPYAWGGAGGSWDCSSLVRDVYSCFGFQLPRDADEQQKIPGTKLALTGLTMGQKLRALRAVPPGAMLHFDGHVMLWIGMEGGIPYVLHALHQAMAPGSAEMLGGRVLISDLSLCRNDGRSFLEHLSLVCWV